MSLFFFFFEWFGSCTKHSVWQDTWWCCFYWFLQMFLMEIPQHAMFLCCLTLKYSNIVWFGVICSNDDQNTYIIYLINFFWVGGYDNVQNEVTEICQLFGQSISFPLIFLVVLGHRGKCCKSMSRTFLLAILDLHEFCN